MGVLILNKPKGLSSFKALKSVQKVFGNAKAGHAGTLDPLATGILPIFFDRATKFIQFLPDHTKTYSASFILGQSSDTEDIEGTIAFFKNEKIPSEKELNESVQSFLGNYDQSAPIFSAKKIKGTPMYKLARKGIELEKRIKTVHINEIKLLKYEYPYFEIEANVSSGTYIRTLGVDIAEKIGCNCVLSDLVRTKFGTMTLEDSISIDALKNLDNIEKMQYVKRVEKILESIPKVKIDSSEVKKFQNGSTFRVNEKKENDKNLVFHNEEFIGIGDIDDNNMLKPIRVYKI